MAEKENMDRAAIGKNAGIVGIGVNLFLFAFKLLAGILSGSVSIIADAMNNLSDSGSSIIVMVGYILSSKPADKDHPYGHARMEYLCSLFVSIIVTILGIELLRSSIEAFVNALNGGEAAHYPVISIVIMAVSVAVKLFLALFYSKTGKKINSESLKASATDSIGDVFATLAVIVGIILTPVIGPIADGIFGFIIAVYILIAGIKLVKEASDTLIGTAPDKELVDSIAEKVKSYDGILGIHDLVVHNYGVDTYFVSVHMEVDASVDVSVSHDLVDRIEDDFRKENGIQLTGHLDPVIINDDRINALRNDVAAIIEEISEEHNSPASFHDFRVLFAEHETRLFFDVSIGSDFPLDNDGVQELMNKKINEKIGEGYALFLTIDRDYITSRY